MTPQKRQIIGIKKLGPVVVDNSSKKIERIWQRNDGKVKRVKVELQTVFEIIAEAKEVILVYSQYITHSEILEEMRKANKRGVNIYCLVEGIEHHLDLEDFATIRSRDQLHSTMVIADPKGSYARGIFFTGELTTRQDPKSSLISLDQEQARGMGVQFMHLFWNGATKERVNGKTVDPMPNRTPLPEVPSYVYRTLRTRDIKDIKSIVGDSPIEEIWITKNPPSRCYSLASEARKLLLEIGEPMKKKISWADMKDNTIMGVHQLPFFFIRSKGVGAIMNPDLGLILNEEQLSDVLKGRPAGIWTHRSNVKLDGLSGFVLPFEGSWDDIKEIEVEAERTVDLGTVTAQKMDDWVSGIPAPEPKIDDQYVMRWAFTSQLAPPVPPADAEKDRLYGQWKKFDEGLKRACSDLMKQLERETADMTNIERLSHSKTTESIMRSLANLKAIDLSISSSQSMANDIITRLRDIEDGLARISEKTDNKAEENEAPDEIQATGKNPQKAQKVVGTKRSQDLRVLLPSEPVPPIGELFENKRKERFLAIDYVDQIDEAKKIAKQYHATVVAKTKGG